MLNFANYKNDRFRHIYTGFFMVRFSRLPINCDNHMNVQITANKCLDLIPPWFDGKQTRD